MDLQTRVAVITGSGRGIGRALALEFARNGAAVVCYARTEEDIQETAALIRRENGKCLPVPTDVLVKNKTSLGDGLGVFPVLETKHLRLREIRPEEDAAAWLPARSRSQGDESAKSSRLGIDRETDFKNASLAQLVKDLEGVRSRFYDLKYVIYRAITSRPMTR
jgi:NAD(P)-dependent dehydrogenase (short-subunit alcohol dehydrogenase family)